MKEYIIIILHGENKVIYPCSDNDSNHDLTSGPYFDKLDAQGALYKQITEQEMKDLLSVSAYEEMNKEGIYFFDDE